MKISFLLIQFLVTFLIAEKNCPPGYRLIHNNANVFCQRCKACNIGMESRNCIKNQLYNLTSRMYCRPCGHGFYKDKVVIDKPLCHLCRSSCNVNEVEVIRCSLITQRKCSCKPHFEYNQNTGICKSVQYLYHMTRILVSTTTPTTSIMTSTIIQTSYKQRMHSDVYPVLAVTVPLLLSILILVTCICKITYKRNCKSSSTVTRLYSVECADVESASLCSDNDTKKGSSDMDMAFSAETNIKQLLLNDYDGCPCDNGEVHYVLTRQFSMDNKNNESHVSDANEKFTGKHNDFSSNELDSYVNLNIESNHEDIKLGKADINEEIAELNLYEYDTANIGALDRNTKEMSRDSTKQGIIDVFYGDVEKAKLYDGGTNIIDTSGQIDDTAICNKVFDALGHVEQSELDLLEKGGLYIHIFKKCVLITADCSLYDVNDEYLRLTIPEKITRPLSLGGGRIIETVKEWHEYSLQNFKRLCTNKVFSFVKEENMAEIVKMFVAYLESSSTYGLVCGGYDLRKHFDFFGYSHLVSDVNKNRILVINPNYSIMVNFCITYGQDIESIRIAQKECNKDLKAIRVIYQELLETNELMLCSVVVTPNLSLDDVKQLPSCLCRILLLTKCDMQDEQTLKFWWENVLMCNIYRTIKKYTFFVENKFLSEELFFDLASQIYTIMASQDVLLLSSNIYDQVQTILLNEDQMNVLNHPAKHKIISGPYGSGKSTIGLLLLESMYKQIASNDNSKAVLYYICFDPLSVFCSKYFENFHYRFFKNKNVSIFCKNVCELANDDVDMYSVSDVLEYLCKLYIGYTMHFVIDEIDGESINQEEACKLHSLSDQLYESNVMLIMQSLEKKRIICNNGVTWEHKTRCFDETKMPLFMLRKSMRTTIQINEVLKSAQSIIENRSDKYCHAIHNTKDNGDSNSDNDTNRIKGGLANTIVTNFKFSCESNIGHSISGAKPNLISFLIKAISVNIVSVVIDNILKKPNGFMKRVIICNNLKSHELAINMMDNLCWKYIGYTPSLQHSNSILSQQKENIFKQFHLHETSVLITDSQGFRGLEADEVIIFMDLDEPRGNQYIVEDISRSTAVLSIVALQTLEIDETCKLSNIVKKWREDSLVQLYDVCSEDNNDRTTLKIKHNETETCFIQTNSGKFKLIMENKVKNFPALQPFSKIDLMFTSFKVGMACLLTNINAINRNGNLVKDKCHDPSIIKSLGKSLLDILKITLEMFTKDSKVSITEDMINIQSIQFTFPTEHSISVSMKFLVGIYHEFLENPFSTESEVLFDHLKKPVNEMLESYLESEVHIYCSSWVYASEGDVLFTHLSHAELNIMADHFDQSDHWIRLKDYLSEKYILIKDEMNKLLHSCDGARNPEIMFMDIMFQRNPLLIVHEFKKVLVKLNLQKVLSVLKDVSNSSLLNEISEDVYSNLLITLKVNDDNTIPVWQLVAKEFQFSVPEVMDKFEIKKSNFSPFINIVGILRLYYPKLLVRDFVAILNDIGLPDMAMMLKEYSML